VLYPPLLILLPQPLCPRADDAPQLAIIAEWALQRTGLFNSRPNEDARPACCTPKRVISDMYLSRLTEPGNLVISDLCLLRVYSSHTRAADLLSDKPGSHPLESTTYASELGFKEDADIAVRQSGVMRVNCIDSLGEYVWSSDTVHVMLR